MAINHNSSLKNNSPYANDYFYCQPNSSTPWGSVSDAHNGMDQVYRGIGKTFLVDTGTGPTEYWYVGGTALQNLVPKQTGSQSSLPKMTRVDLAGSSNITSTIVKLTDVIGKNYAVYDSFDTTSNASTNIVVSADNKRWVLHDSDSILEALVYNYGIRKNDVA